MPVTPTYPGVYVQEVPSGVRTIVGSPTSIGLFIGAANEGPVNDPVQCLSFSDFTRAFGDHSRYTNLGRYLRLFFMNGGSNCYVMRIAANVAAAHVTLNTEAGAGNTALVLTAKQQGKLGNQIRAEVSYSTSRPESTFNIDIFRWQQTSSGLQQRQSLESFKNLTMDSSSPSYAVDFITQNSKLVDATVPAVPVAGDGSSQSGRHIVHANTAADFEAKVTALMGSTAGAANSFQIIIGGSAPVDVDLHAIVLPTGAATLAPARAAIGGAIQTEIRNRLAAKGILDPVLAEFIDGHTATTTSLFRIRLAAPGKEIIVRAASLPANDLTKKMMLGMDQGGLEIGPFAASRPAPSGVTFRVTDAANAMSPFARAKQSSIEEIDLVPWAPGVTNPFYLHGPDTLATTGGANDLMSKDAYVGSPSANSDGVREKFGIIVEALQEFTAADSSVDWRSEIWGNYRLAFLRSTSGSDDQNIVPAITSTAAAGPYSVVSAFNKNVRYYSLGANGAGAFQENGADGNDGSQPTAAEYTAAFAIADNQVDLFNLMVLPPDATTPMEDGIYAEASGFCKKRRAFLVMDPPPSWSGKQQKAAISALRIGVEKDYAALYYPRLTTKEDGRDVTVGPSGAIAGLMGRIDGTRGVWKAPAGTEATLSGVVGLEQLFTDDENGVMNPRAINIIRTFPNGIVSWGARTMDGDDDFGSEYKYIPIRRLAMFIEETLYRNLKWVVFEPNDEPLWAQIRLNVGAFMQDLFRKGAFEGRSPKDAYFVRCDGETTTANDRNLGIVNIWVGFAPLKPAEFVIIYIQQKAAQAEV